MKLPETQRNNTLVNNAYTTSKVVLPNTQITKIEIPVFEIFNAYTNSKVEEKSISETFDASKSKKNLNITTNPPLNVYTNSRVESSHSINNPELNQTNKTNHVKQSLNTLSTIESYL
jgi:hypothetical protein